MKTLFFYELKKVVNRKLVWICMIISVLLIIISLASPLLGSYLVDGEAICSNYEYYQEDVLYQKNLDGRSIDGVLIKEMQTAYENVPLEEKRYSLTEVYQENARPYSAIFNYVRQTTGLSGAGVGNLEASTEELRKKRLELRETRWEEALLTDGEKVYWKEQEARIENPVVFRYAEGYSALLSAAYTVGIVGVFMVAVCLAGVFPEEHVRKTDQLLLSSKLGRGDIYWAKFAAGTVTSLLTTVLFSAVAFLTAFVLYGTQGFEAAFQLFYAGSSYPVSVGQAVLIIYAMVVCAGTFMGIFVMALSEVLHSSFGTLAIAIGLIVLPMLVSIPDGYRLIAQIWGYLPSEIVAVWSCFSLRTVAFGKIFLQSWQVVPMLYSVLGIGAAVLTKRVFIRYQVG